MLVVFGGSFNPPTRAHGRLAQAVLDQTKAERLILLPVGDRYDKPQLAAAQHRLAMCRLMAAADPRLAVSDLEAGTMEQLGTYVTLCRLQEQNAQDELAFLTGADNFSYITKWLNAEALLSSFAIWIMPREGYDVQAYIDAEPLLQQNAERLHLLQGLPLLDISATEIRDKLRRGDYTGLELEETVLAYIRAHRLYGV